MMDQVRWGAVRNLHTTRQERMELGLKLLGSPAIRRLDPPGRWTPLTSSRALALAYLAIEGHEVPVRRETLLPILWEEADQHHARCDLRQLVAQLRGDCGVEVLSPSRETLILDPNALRCDVWELHRAVTEGRCDDAVGMYRGPLLEGVHLGRGHAWSDWLMARRSWISRLVCDVLRAQARRDAKGGRTTRAIDHAHRAVQLDPFSERGLRELLRLLFGVGDDARAFEEYGRFRSRMLDEFGEEPSSRTRELVAQRGDGLPEA